MNRLLLFLLIASGLMSCKKSETATNKFSDPVLLKIADLQDRGSSDSLYTYFSHENALYRREAVLTFASIQDSAAVEKIAALMQADPDTSVRKASAFAIGQIRSERRKTKTLRKPGWFKFRMMIDVIRKPESTKNKSTPVSPNQKPRGK